MRVFLYKDYHPFLTNNQSIVEATALMNNEQCKTIAEILEREEDSVFDSFRQYILTITSRDGGLSSRIIKGELGELGLYLSHELVAKGLLNKREVILLSKENTLPYVQFYKKDVFVEPLV